VLPSLLGKAATAEPVKIATASPANNIAIKCFFMVASFLKNLSVCPVDLVSPVLQSPAGRTQASDSHVLHILSIIIGCSKQYPPPSLSG
jgi:hypothetical protein